MHLIAVHLLVYITSGVMEVRQFFSRDPLLYLNDANFSVYISREITAYSSAIALFFSDPL